MEPETDPQKIAAALERTRQVRLNNRFSSYEEGAEQILRHSWEAGQITEKEFRRRLEEAKSFIRKQRADGRA